MPATGLRTYLTVRGGIDVPPVLGSRSTDTLSRLGPPPVRVGDLLPVGTPGRDFPTVDHAAHPPAGQRRTRRCSRCGPARARPGSAAGPPGWAACSGCERVVVGGQRPGRGAARPAPPCSAPARWRDVELPSEGMVRGAVQVPPGGEPVRLPRRPPRDRRLPRGRGAHGIRLRPRRPAAPGRHGAAGPGGPAQLRWVGSHAAAVRVVAARLGTAAARRARWWCRAARTARRPTSTSGSCCRWPRSRAAPARCTPGSRRRRSPRGVGYDTTRKSRRDPLRAVLPHRHDVDDLLGLEAEPGDVVGVHDDDAAAAGQPAVAVVEAVDRGVELVVAAQRLQQQAALGHLEHLERAHARTPPCPTGCRRSGCPAAGAAARSRRAASTFSS